MSRLLSLLAVLATALPAAAQLFTWNTQTGTWNAPANWVGNAVPPSDSATQLVFNNAGAAYTTTNDIGAFTLNRLTVNNTGTGPITIAAAIATNTITFAGTDPTLDVQAGTVTITAVLAGTANLVKTGAGTAIQASNSNGFTGTLTVNAGVFASENPTDSGTHNFNPTDIVVNTGGTYRFGNNGIGNPNLPENAGGTYLTANPGGTVVWQEGEQIGGFNLQGGVIDFQQGGASAFGNRGGQTWTTGTFTGGAFNLELRADNPINKTTAGTVSVTGSARFSGAGAINIQAGTVAFAAAANLANTNPISLGDPGGTSAGTLEYQGATDATRGGTVTANPGGGVVSVGNATAVLTLSGAVAGTGPLTKTGPGTLLLAAAPTNTGLTTVSGGTLRVNPGAAAGGFQVNDGATLAVAAGAGTATFATPSLALTGAAPAVQFELNAAGLPTAPLLAAPALTGGGVLRLTNQQPFALGTYQLVDYSGAAITTGFSLQLPGRTAGSLVYNTADTRLDATVTGTDTIRWGGQVSGVWDVGTAAGVGGTSNWRLVSNSAGTNFIQTDIVTFDDTGLNPTIDITTAVQPAAVTVNNGSVQYVFGGAGRITGGGSLTKLGTGSLVIGTDNDYTGGTTVNGGLLQFGTGGTAGSVTGGVSLADNTTLAFNRSAAATMANPLTAAGSLALRQNGAGAITLTSPLNIGANTLTVDGPGDLLLGGALTGTATATLTKTGAGTLTLLANNNPFVGTLTVNAGAVSLDDRGGSGGDFGGSIVVNSGGTFQFGNTDQVGNPDLPEPSVITANTGGTVVWNIGENFGGFNLRGGELRQRGTTVNASSISLGITTAPSQWTAGTVVNIGGTATPGVNGANQIVKTTAGTVTITGVNLNTTGGAVAGSPAIGLAIEEGVIASDAGFGGLGGISFGTASTAGTLRLTNADAATPSVIARPLTVNAGGGTIDVTTAGKVYAFTGGAAGTGTLTKAGPGALAASGTVAGPLAVSAGALVPGTGLTARTLALQGGLTLAAGSALRAPLFGTAANSDNGVAAVTGTATIASGALLQLDLSLLDQAGVNAVRSNGPQTYTVLTAATVAGSFAAVDAGGSNFGLFSASEFALLGSPAAGTVQVLFTPVPEPLTVLAVAAAGLGLARARRTRRA